MRKEKGITLVALVITIIILLILAGITFATLMGNNGLLIKAGKAKNRNIEAEDIEKIQLAVMSSYDNAGINKTFLAKNLSLIEGLTDTNNQAITENTEITLPKVVNLNKLSYKIDIKGEVYKYYNSNGLILHLDGINNTRNGHSTTTTRWEDLSGNNNDFTKLSSASNPTWSDNSYVGDATNRTLILNKAILSNSNACSVEVCYDIPILPASNKYYWIFQNRQKENPENGFQFSVSPSGHRSVGLWGDNSVSNTLYKLNGKIIYDLGKKTFAFAVDNTDITFSVNGLIYEGKTIDGVINSIIQRNYYSIGSSFPWGNAGRGTHLFNGNIYSIRVYNRKLSENELKNNYEVDRVRFNMD